MNAEFPEKLQFLFRPNRYKILYGGRGGAKSWGVARALLILGASKPLRILCAREFQNSMQDSVQKLLQDQIDSLGLTAFYEVQKTLIRGRNGTEFAFEGLRHNVTKIKSFEGADICWVEEAQTVSKTSWDVLVPTIRKEGSEIWITFNPELEDDETYKRFVTNPPASAQVVKLNWSDNPWFPQVLRDEKDSLKERDPDAYLTVWEGHCRQTLDGAVYAAELREAQESGRIMRVPYDATKPVHTFWDLGWSDMTSIWFAQAIGFEYRLIRYVQGNHKKVSDWVAELQKFGYVYGVDWLPHDGANETMAGRSIAEQMRAAGRAVNVLPRIAINDGINAARTIFSQCYFDEANCADGLQCLRHYRYEYDEDRRTYKKEPLHDWASHGSDAFRYLALSLQGETKRKKPKQHANTGWMG